MVRFAPSIQVGRSDPPPLRFPEQSHSQPHRVATIRFSKSGLDYGHASASPGVAHRVSYL